MGAKRYVEQTRLNPGCYPVELQVFPQLLKGKRSDKKEKTSANRGFSFFAIYGKNPFEKKKEGKAKEKNSFATLQ
ncbi:hypothetical protein [Syntrophomonas curvata]